jgi:hypothetical protein
MKAPKIQRIGKKIPKKNIQPCPFLSVINPSVNATIRYKMPPIPIAQYMVASLVDKPEGSHFGPLANDLLRAVPVRLGLVALVRARRSRSSWTWWLQTVRARGVCNGNANLHHRVLQLEASSPTGTVEVRYRSNPLC